MQVEVTWPVSSLLETVQEKTCWVSANARALVDKVVGRGETWDLEDALCWVRRRGCRQPVQQEMTKPGILS